MPTDKNLLDAIIRNQKKAYFDPLSPLIDEYYMKRDKPKYIERRIKSYTFPVVSRNRPGGRLSPSNICGCQRKAALTFLRTPGRKRANPKLEIIFDDGNWRHHRWQYVFMDMERVLGSDRFRCLGVEGSIQLDKNFIAGHYDCLVEINTKDGWIKILVDYKGTNSYAFSQMINTEEAKEEHRKQLVPYMKATGVKHGVLLYEGKNDNDTECLYVDLTDERWKEVKEWSAEVIVQIRDKKIPPKHPGCVDGNFMWEQCQFRRLCFGSMTDRQLQKIAYEEFESVEASWQEGLKQDQEEEESRSVT